MEQTDAFGLAGMVCARVCHDLAGTLGALTGALEMVADAPDQEALALAQDCARELAARLRLLRAAWGSDSEVDDLATLLPGLPNFGKLRVSLEQALLEDDAVRQFGACLLLVGAGALPMGGAIWLRGTGRSLLLRVEGRRATWPAGLMQKDGPVEPRGVAAAMARLRAESLGVVLRLRSEWELETA